jgi:hypothetical protein
MSGAHDRTAVQFCHVSSTTLPASRRWGSLYKTGALIMKTLTNGRHLRGYLTGIAAVILTGTGVLAAPQATASQPTGDGGDTQCTLGVWYAVHNPSIAKPRGNQNEQDRRTAQTGPCPM